MVLLKIFVSLYPYSVISLTKVSLVRLCGVLGASLKGYDPSTSTCESQQFKSLPGNHNCNYYIIASLLKYVPFVIMSYFFSTPVDIDIVLEDNDEKAMVDLKLDKNRREKAPLYMDGESVKGAVTIRPKDGKRLEHTGIKVQFIGTIGTRFNSVVLMKHLLTL